MSLLTSITDYRDSKLIVFESYKFIEYFIVSFLNINGDIITDITVTPVG